MDQHELAEEMRWHAGWCERLGSALYTDLLKRLATDVEAGGVSWRLLESQSGLPKRSLPLRFLGAVHRLVLEGELPQLSRYYPSVSTGMSASVSDGSSTSESTGPSAGGSVDADGVWAAFAAALEQHGELIRTRIPANVQTNETGRCAALLPGFREIVRQTKLPLRLLEVGCSAGLNLRFDHMLDCRDIRVIERRGCDLNPIDLDSQNGDDGRLTLLSFVWPDQTARFRQLSRAIEIARRVPATIKRADALEWIERELANPTPGSAGLSPGGATTVVFHSIVMPYLSQEQRDRFSQLLHSFGERATAEAPLAWLSMEPGEEAAGEQAAVELTVWHRGDGRGVRRRIATSGFHGQNVVLQ